MANPTTNFGWVMPTSTSLVTNLPADFNTFGQAVDTSMAYLKGGTTGQILSKTSATDMAFTWITNDVGDITGVTAGTGISGGGTSGDVTVTNSMATAMTTKGDLVAATGSGTFSRLAVGSNNQTLLADSSTSTGLKWATPASGGGLTVIATGTLSGSSVVVSSIPATYKHLMVSVYAATWDTANDGYQVRYNAVTTNYTRSSYGHADTTANNAGASNAGGWFHSDGGGNALRTGAENHWNWIIYDYTATTGVMNASGTAAYKNTGSTWSKMNSAFSNQATAVAVTSITIMNTSGTTQTGGTYTVYGVS